MIDDARRKSLAGYRLAPSDEPYPCLRSWLLTADLPGICGRPSPNGYVYAALSLGRPSPSQ